MRCRTDRHFSKLLVDQKGVTLVVALFMVMIIGIMCAETGKSWSLYMKREREKELLFRGSQIKSAIENWYRPKYNPSGGAALKSVVPLMDLKDLMGGNQLQKQYYLPHTYATELEANARCTPNCPKLKIYQDPMTGKEWTLIKCPAPNSLCQKFPGTNIIIGVASKSEDRPFRDTATFKDTELENIGTAGFGATETSQASSAISVTPSVPPGGGSAGAEKVTKYSQWRFVADEQNDHSKLYRSYHESW